MAKNLKQLLAQIEKLQDQADALRQKERSDVIGRIQEAIAHYDLTAEELFAKPVKEINTSGARKAKGGKAAKVSMVTGKAKYQDGKGRTWTGRGKRPSWFVAAIEEGKTAGSMLVNPE
ncbi:H-NS histone family protein [Paucibacter sp. M5-1]|uniref:H-NS histone family protein n=1 Tax=Paucibacter sp. M5-1 TaxID=3015998 RepID=UPI0022B8D281|nr:H-NS histone family protein [Paucibacter sp. M5-1]MCZ7880612.1 H-NS histone family protein [Paucibacter sp. M5-1]